MSNISFCKFINQKQIRLNKRYNVDLMLKVNEIYFSIQGESTKAGLPCVFIRFTYCNLRCTYCDTEYAFYEGTDFSIEEIIQKVKKYK